MTIVAISGDYPYHIINRVGEDATLHDIVIIILDSMGFAPNIAVMLMSGNNVYSGITSKYGIVFPNLANESYTLYIAEKDKNQEQIDGVEFDEAKKLIRIKYIGQNKTRWDGMYASTPPEMYVNTYDGGHA